ncbi:MAG: DUF3011 domain-containing protein [Bdellovibrionota bacterium]
MKLLVLLTMFLGFNAHAQFVEVQREFQCASINNNYAECHTGLERTHQLYMSRQISKSACIEGHSYRLMGDRVTVSNGCRAIFVARGITNYPQPGDQVIENTVSVRIRCESQNHNTAQCRIPLRRVRQVYLEQQHSKSACIEGHSYFVNDRYITVTNGCRATFVANGIQ